MSSLTTMMISVYIKTNKPNKPSEAADSSESSKGNLFNSDKIDNDLMKTESAAEVECAIEINLLYWTSSTWHM